MKNMKNHKKRNSRGIKHAESTLKSLIQHVNCLLTIAYVKIKNPARGGTKKTPARPGLSASTVAVNCNTGA